MAERKVPFFNYQALFSADEAGLMGVIRDVCARGAYIMQSDLHELERELSTFIGVKHVLGVADGTNALILGLWAMGIGAGDEVIVPSHTYVASAASIHFVGARPVLVECGAGHLIDPQSVERAVTPRTKAIMPVQLNGRTAAMDPLLAIARDRGLRIIEDAAQALGSKYRGRSAGTFGVCGTYSFYPAKVLGCFGDGGAIVTNDDDIADSLIRLRDHGRGRDGVVNGWGTNSRLDNLQAAILRYKLSSFPGEIERRRAIASLYTHELSSLEDLVLPPPPESDAHFDVYQNYEIESGRRDELKAHLASRGVTALVQWGGKAVHHLAGLGFEGVSLPVTDRLFTRCMMLPMNTTLTDDDVAYVASVIKEFYGAK